MISIGVDQVRRAILSERAALLALVFMATLLAERRIIWDPYTFPVDASIHTYWMYQFEDPQLFAGDPLTMERAGQVPPALLLTYRLVSLAVSPITVSELLPLLIVPFTVWLVFQISREIAPWRPAAWIASLTYMFAWDVHRFSGGHARAFAVPLALAVVLLALRRRERSAGIAPGIGALIYPPGAIAALGILGFSWIRWSHWPPWAGRRLLILLGSGTLIVTAVLTTSFLVPSSQFSVESGRRDEIERAPELGPDGQRPFFADSTVEFLRQNRSGFHVRRSGAILFLAAGLLLIVRPRNARLFPREVWAIPLASLTLFALAHALLPLLYWPHRYTYPLLPFACIVIGVALRPTLDPLRARIRASWILALSAVIGAAVTVLLALTVFPLGPGWGTARVRGFMPIAIPICSICLAIAGLLLLSRRWRTGAQPGSGVVATSLAAAILVGSVAATGKFRVQEDACPDHQVLRFLSTLPKSSVIAGDPFDMTCVPIVARRPVVISTKLYSLSHRQRMMDVVQAYYGPSIGAILGLRERYSADFLLVRPDLLTGSGLPRRWRLMEPFTTRLREILERGQKPASLTLAPECRRYLDEDVQVFELSCLATSALSE